MESIKVLPGMFGQLYLWYSDINASRWGGVNRWFLIVYPGGQFRAHGINSLNTGVSGSLDDTLAATYRDVSSYEWFDVYACNNQPTLPVATPGSNGAYSFIGRYINPLYNQTVAPPVLTMEAVEIVNPDNVNIANMALERYTSGSGLFAEEYSNIRWRITGLPIASGGFTLNGHSLFLFKTRPVLNGNAIPTGAEIQISRIYSTAVYVTLYGSVPNLDTNTIKTETFAPWIPNTLVPRYCAAGEEFWGILRPLLYGGNTVEPFAVLLRFRVRCNVPPLTPVLSATEYEVGFAGDTPVATLSAVDVNEFDTVTFAKTVETKGVTDTDYFSIGEDNRLIAAEGTPPGVYSLTIVASDGIASASVTAPFTVTVPVIDSFTATPITGDSVRCQFLLPEAISEEATIQWQRSAVDPDSPEFEEWETMETTII